MNTYKRLWFIALSIAVCLCAQAQADHIEDYVPQHYMPEIYHGIDVSNHQGRIDWKTVSKDGNVQFVYIKATEGATYVSPTFESNIKEARKAGLKVGCYHFLRATSYIHDQFKNFTEYCKQEEQDLAPLIDIEVKGRWTPQQLVDSLQLFADMLENHYGRRPVISVPERTIRPFCGFRRPAITFRSVVFPAPLGPLRQTHSPFSAAKETSFRTGVS